MIQPDGRSAVCIMHTLPAVGASQLRRRGGGADRCMSYRARRGHLVLIPGRCAEPFTKLDSNTSLRLFSMRLSIVEYLTASARASMLLPRVMK